MKTYVGVRGDGDVSVIVDTGTGQRPLRHIVYHSPTGMEWSYTGSGPADLALSILVDALGENRRWQLRHGDASFGFRRGGSRVPYESLAWDLHHEFQRDIVAGFDRAHFVVTETEVAAWVAQHSAEAPDEALGL